MRDDYYVVIPNPARVTRVPAISRYAHVEVPLTARVLRKARGRKGPLVWADYPPLLLGLCPKPPVQPCGLMLVDLRSFRDDLKNTPF